MRGAVVGSSAQGRLERRTCQSPSDQRRRACGQPSTQPTPRRASAAAACTGPTCASAGELGAVQWSGRRRCGVSRRERRIDAPVHCRPRGVVTGGARRRGSVSAPSQSSSAALVDWRRPALARRDEVVDGGRDESGGRHGGCWVAIRYSKLYGIAPALPPPPSPSRPPQLTNPARTSTSSSSAHYEPSLWCQSLATIHRVRKAAPLTNL